MSQTKRKHTTTLAGETITYEVSTSDDANHPRIDAGIDGITVVLPTGADKKPEAFLKENADWVLDKKTKFDQYRDQIPNRTFEAGETFPYLGEDYTLVIEPRQKSVAADGEIRLRQSAVNQSSVERALRNFYRREARRYLTDRLDHYAGEMGLSYDGLQIRNQRTRWGSCSTNGTISLNYRLMLAPPDVVDYVVVHELAHLREPNHTEAFWAIIGEYFSEYDQYREWLDKNSTRLTLSRADL